MDQLKTLGEVQNILLDYADKTLILGGDLNSRIFPQLDKHGGKIEKQSE